MDTLTKLHRIIGNGKLPFCKCTENCCSANPIILLYPIESNDKYFICNDDGSNCDLDLKPLLCKFYPFFPHRVTRRGIQLKIANCRITKNLNHPRIKHHINLVGKCTLLLHQEGLTEFIIDSTKYIKNTLIIKDF